MLSLNEKQFLSEILLDYLKFSKRVIKDDGSIMNIVDILQKQNLKKKVLTKKQLADELGIDKRTLLKKIHATSDLVDALIDKGWRPKQRGFYPKEVKIIKKWLF